MMRRSKSLVLTFCAAIALAAPACNNAQPAPDPAKAVAAAIADPGRSAQRGADERRKPEPLILLSGMKPGDKVLDLIPGDGYWTRIFSKIVGPEGKVYAIWPQNYARFSVGKVEAMQKLAGSPGYENVAMAVQPSTVLSAPEPLDMVWTSQNYHDYPDEFMGKTDPAVLNKAVFDMLKPGGTYMIIDHIAATGRGMEDTEKLHRIEPATVRAQVEAAGFVYEGESEVLNNPADPLDIAVFDPKVRNRTSQFAYRFRKP
jgi:predicted methyltransferase